MPFLDYGINLFICGSSNMTYKELKSIFQSLWLPIIKKILIIDIVDINYKSCYGFILK
jgi:hypothetical protein